LFIRNWDKKTIRKQNKFSAVVLNELGCNIKLDRKEQRGDKGTVPAYLE
jgi:hypothetical protein